MGIRFGLPWLGVAATALAVAVLLAASGPAGGSPSSSSEVTSVAVGVDHTCALTSAGGVRCWGDNANGEVGDGTASERHYPVNVVGLAKGVQAIAAGEYYSCALTNGGAVRCWGDNHFGQLGDGKTVDRRTPVGVSGLVSGVQAIAAGATHACALTTAGAVKCWGYNAHGELGDGTTASRRAPVAVKGLAGGAIAITAGLEDTCAVTAAGAAKCWGENLYGKLGDGTATDRYEPVDVAGLGGGVTAISASDSEGHTCALLSAGGLKCWGNNAFGELGDGTANLRYTAGGVAGLASGVAAVAAGGFYTCALTGAGAAECWGDNGDGELGSGTRGDRWTAGDVSGLTSGVTAIAAGLTHACAVAGGAVRCWGDNAFGELGNGTMVEHSRPTPVSFAGCVVPNVVGKALASAAAMLAKARCGLGTLRKRLSPVKQKGYVLAETPRPGRKLPAAGRVDLTVGKGPR